LIVDSSVDFVDGDLPCEGRCLVELFSQRDARARLPQALPHDTFETLRCGGGIAGLGNAVILCIIRRVKALQEREVSR
jgi:hypothetical protein